MLRSTLKTGLVATALLAAVVGPATAASAQSATITDSEGDVWQIFSDYSTGETAYTAAGSQTNVDVLSTVVTHTGRRVNATLTYTDLAKEGARPSAVVLMRFDSGPQRFAVVDTSGSWKGKDVLVKNGKNSGGPVACAGFTHEIDYTANTIVMSVPRSCLGSPTWVEASVMSQGWIEGGETEETSTSFFDNGAKPGHSYTPTWTGKIRKG
jgi:hypothetical protein